MDSPPRAGYSQLARVFTRLSLLGFGGPNAHIALMLEEVVERRRWISREHFLHLVAVTNLLPGPNSSEVAIHIGHTQRGWRGGLLAGFCFVAPTFLMVLVLSHLYFSYGTLPAMEDVLWGIKPVIVAIILSAGIKLAQSAITDRKLFTIALAGTATTILLPGWEIATMATAAVIGIGLYGRSGGSATRPNMMLPLAPLALVGLGPAAKVFWLALITGSVLFGGGYMLVPLLEPQVVHSLGWLTREQFLDGIAITQAVPGPIVTLVAFVGYSVAGVAGATLATLGIYIPSFASVFLVAPHMDRWRSMDSVRAALRGVNAVVAGAILGAALRLSPAAIAGVGAVILLLGALIALVRFGIPAVWLVACGLLAGLLRTAL